MSENIEKRMLEAWKRLPGESEPTYENSAVRYVQEFGDGQKDRGSYEAIEHYEKTQQEEYERWQKRLSWGRYTLNEAGLAFAKGSNENPSIFFTRLVKALECGIVPQYTPGRNLRKETPGWPMARDEMHWEDLNDWLNNEEYFKLIKWRFPKPKLIGDTETPQKKWSDSDCKALAKEHRALKKDDNKRPTATLAKKYGISDSRIRALIRRTKKAESENSWQKNVGAR